MMNMQIQGGWDYSPDPNIPAFCHKNIVLNLLFNRIIHKEVESMENT